jgi:hypothetical protein
MHGGRAAEVHYGGLAGGIITMADAVMTDKTGWSSPIGAARQAECKTTRGPNPCDIYHTCSPAIVVSPSV